MVQYEHFYLKKNGINTVADEFQKYLYKKNMTFRKQISVHLPKPNADQSNSL